MEVRIFQSETVKEMADKIFHHFQLNQSCKVADIVIIDGRVVEKGKAVIDQLAILDQTYNTINGKRKRRRAGPNAIGGEVAHKIFKYQRTIRDEVITYTIWRLQ